MNKSASHNHNLIRDLAIVAFSIFVAFYIKQNDLISPLLSYLPAVKAVGAFFAGLFFTSVFTTAPAIIALTEIAKFNSVILVALFGAAGAVIGDIIIFQFARDHLFDDFIELAKHVTPRARLRHIFKSKIMRFTITILGGLIIASPFPDEIGLTLLGMAKIKNKFFIPLSFVFNFIGILIIGLLAKRLGP